MVDRANPRREGSCTVATKRPQHATRRNVAANVCAEHGEEDNDEEAEGAGIGVCGLAVQLGEREWPRVGEERVEIVDGVEDCYDVAKGGGEADYILRKDGFGDVHARSRNFFRKVGYTVTLHVLADQDRNGESGRILRSSNSERAIEHTGDENKAVTSPARLVRPLFPDKRAARVAFTSLTRHDCAHKNCDCDTSEDEEQAELGDGWQRAIHVHDDEG